MERISKEENERVVGMLKSLIDGAKNLDDCANTSEEIFKYDLNGYNVVNLDRELYYRKGRWIMNLEDITCQS